MNLKIQVVITSTSYDYMYDCFVSLSYIYIYTDRYHNYSIAEQNMCANLEI